MKLKVLHLGTRYQPTKHAAFRAGMVACQAKIRDAITVAVEGALVTSTIGDGHPVMSAHVDVGRQFAFGTQVAETEVSVVGADAVHMTQKSREFLHIGNLVNAIDETQITGGYAFLRS